MKIIESNSISEKRYNNLLKRPAINFSGVKLLCENILHDIKLNGTKAIIKYAIKIDGFAGGSLQVSKKEIDCAESELSADVKRALKTAAGNIKKFHMMQVPQNYSIETMKGIICERRFLAIENVGLYIPGGSATLPSTMLMLGIPAKIAGCKRIVVCSPANNGKLNAEVLYAAKLTGVNEIYKVGGAQAIGLMAYGSNEIKKVDKIFGPGNQYVTTAKALVSIDPDGCSIDMLAGPSEVLVIADKFADSKFIASDLLSQAEHGIDSQVILLTESKNLAQNVSKDLKVQLSKLPRKKIAEVCLKNSFSLIVNHLQEAVDFANRYAPEHLIINVKNPAEIIRKVVNAGSVFIGQYSPESVGDYASGTNHSLPTYGYARAMGGVSVEMFMKGITFQKLSYEGLKRIAPTVIKLAETEKLEAHANAVKIRIKDGYR